MEVSCNKCADANSGGYGCDGECMWEEKKKTCVHKEDTVLAPVKCGGSSAGFTAPTCRQCRSDYSHDFECRGDCFWRNEDDYPNRPDSLRCTWEGREYQKDRANSLRRDIFATELVAAVNKLRLNNYKAYLRRDENDNWLNRIATSEAERIARTCSSKSKQFNYDGKNNVLTTGLMMSTCDKFPAGTDLVFGDVNGNKPWGQFENTMLQDFVGKVMGVGVSKRRCPGRCNGATVTVVVAIFY